MADLHTVNKSPFEKNSLETAIKYSLPGSAILLLEDGVYGAMQGTAAEEMVKGAMGDKKPFDSNCITPGTDFMLKLSLALQKWVDYKMKTDEYWARSGVEVIVSGPDVPGEGEHKVMDHIRASRESFLEADAADGMPPWRAITMRWIWFVPS